MPLKLSRLFRARTPGAARTSSARTRDVDRVLDLGRALLSARGEVSGARVAAEVLAAYQTLDDEQVEWLFDRLVTTFSVDPKAVQHTATAYQLEGSAANLLALQKAVEPPRQELFRRCNMGPLAPGSLWGGPRLGGCLQQFLVPDAIWRPRDSIEALWLDRPPVHQALSECAVLDSS